MHIIFVNLWNLDTPSGMHIFNLANELVLLGAKVSVFSLNNPETALAYGIPLFQSYAMCDANPEQSFSALSKILSTTSDQYLIHAWTPRKRSRIFTSMLKKHVDAPVVVHMEDNEEVVCKNFTLGISEEDLLKDEVWNEKIMHGISHPIRSHEFMASAQGYTCIIETLLDFKPEYVPGIYFWPSCEEEIFAIPAESDKDLKEQYGIPANHYVVFYPGNVHMGNLDDVMELYGAIGLLHKQGIRIRIIKYGTYAQDIPKMFFGSLGCEECLVDLTGKISPKEIPAIMQMADFLVQLGFDNSFNQYRFPCKLPLFFASGRPVILANTNLGKILTNGENCLLLTTGKAMEIASLLQFLIKKPELAKKIGEKGRKFAGEHFSWKKSAQKVFDFYKKIVADYSA